MDAVKIKLDPRTVTGKKVKRLRREGYVPVHMYGAGADASIHQIEAKVLLRVLPQVGTNVPLTVEVEGQKGDTVCFVREVQRHPVSEDVLHVDFLRVDVSQTIQSEVPVLLIGTAPAVPNMGGTLLQPLQAILVESLPLDVPESFSVDVTALDDFEKAVYVRDVTIVTGVTLLTDPDELIARVSAPRIEIEEVEEEEELEEGELAEGEEGEEGEGAEGAEGEEPAEERRGRQPRP